MTKKVFEDFIKEATDNIEGVEIKGASSGYSYHYNCCHKDVYIYISRSYGTTNIKVAGIDCGDIVKRSIASNFHKVVLKEIKDIKKRQNAERSIRVANLLESKLK